jgi:uncharacterized protein YkwD
MAGKLKSSRVCGFAAAVPANFLPFALVLAATAVSASESSELIDLINVYRAAPQSCEGTRTAATRSLIPNPLLASGRFTPDSPLLDDLKARGYQARSAYLIGVSGPSGARAVMQFIQQRHCASLSSPQYAEIGVARDGNELHIVLARRLLSPDLGDWRAAGNEILRLTNAARAVPRTCGTQRFGAAPPLAWNDRLGATALAHSRDMANQDYADHAGKDGSEPGDRATREGYAWQNIGENIAAGQGSPEYVMSRWLSSPIHCANIMSSVFVEMGAAYALNSGSKATIYWTHMFGRRAGDRANAPNLR